MVSLKKHNNCTSILPISSIKKEVISIEIDYFY